jgi:tRNA-dihydrouridine synthase
MKNKTNVEQAIINFKMWLGWYANDIKGAIEFASDQLETVSDVDEFEAALKKLKTN